jgi:hypothetical protein
VIRFHPVIDVHAGDFVAGLLGGAVVLLGVLLTEALVRHRERHRRLREAAWDLQTAAGGGLMIGHIPGMSGDQLARGLTEFAQQLGRIKNEARWPIPHAKEIRAEVDKIRADLMVATAKMGTGKAGPPKLGPIMGEKLLPMILPEKGLTQRGLNERLRVEGLPTLDVLDDSHNVPMPPP